MIQVSAPGSKGTAIAVVMRRRVEPRDVVVVANGLSPAPSRPVLVTAPFLSLRTRGLLRNCGFAYVDLTGNIRLVLNDPGLFIVVRLVAVTGAAAMAQPELEEER